MPYNFTELSEDQITDDSFISAQFTGVSGNLSVHKRHTSASRATMWEASHSGQKPVLHGSTPRKISSGVEHEYAKYHTGPVMPENGVVFSVVPKRRDIKNQAVNPSSLMIYYAEDTGTYDAIDLRRYHSDHPTFGYKLHLNRDISLNPRTAIPKDTTLASSVSVKNGEYHFGVEANVAFASHASCIEDGIPVRKGWAKNLCTDLIVKRTLSFDKFTIPLNYWGDHEEYRAYLGLGERVKANGVLAVTREITPEFAFLEMTKNALGTELPTDRAIHVPDDAEVIDITAHKGRTSKGNTLPEAMTRQVDEDVEAHNSYRREILATQKRLRKLHGDKLKLGYELHRQIVNAMPVDPNAVPGHRIKVGYRRSPIKNYRIDFELVSNLKARIGHKLTDLHGGKAIVVHLIDDEDAGVDKFGTLIDIFIDPLTTNDRINPGRSYEQYFNAYSDQILRQIKTMNHEEAFAHVMKYYRIVSPFHYNLTGKTVAGCPVRERRHVEWIKRHGIEIVMLSNTKDMGPSQVNRLEKWCPLDYGPISYTDLTGKRVTTYEDIIVGSLYIVMLEKIGDDWSTSSVSTNTHFGLPSKINFIDKYSAPVRNQSVRILGESEVRILLAFMRPEVVKELLMLSSNPSVVRGVVEKILDHDGCSGAINSLDIEWNDTTENRAVQYIKQVLYCYGAVVK